ncbi:MAG: RNA polymerase sigma factor [Saprospiraceae bacterium]|nr:RNA polymerase sigma factor [Saprospiraceae bacterium]
MDEKTIIAKIIEGNQQAFRELVESYQDKVISTCNSFVHNLEDAEDIAQDVFVEIYQSITKFRSDSKFSTWLYRIAVNKSLNHLRKNKKNTMLKSLDSFFGNDKNEKYEISDSKSSQADQNIENNERAEILHNAINSLAKNQRIAFTLNKYDDLSYKEIAEVMNISLSSVEALMHRAKMNLQKKLVNYYR